MGDTTGLYLSYESAIEQFNQRNFLMAAVEAYWCLQYCYYGEPYGIKDLHCYESTADTIFQESKKMLGKPILSKSQYINGCQCLKHLWLHRNKYKEREVPKETQKKYDVGHLIGKLAQNLFPNGKDATPHQCYCERCLQTDSFGSSLHRLMCHCMRHHSLFGL